MQLTLKTTGAKLWWVLVLLVTATSASLGTAQATILQYDFSVTVTSGALAGTTANGRFSFDDVISPPGPLPVYTPTTGGVPVNQTGLLTDLSFTWNGIAYDEATANTGFFLFYQGPVFFACFGTSAGPGSCSVSGPNDWYVHVFPNGGGDFAYEVPAVPGIGSGSVVYSVSVVPEPSVFATLGVGLVILLGAARGSRRNN